MLNRSSTVGSSQEGVHIVSYDLYRLLINVDEAQHALRSATLSFREQERIRDYVPCGFRIRRYRPDKRMVLHTSCAFDALVWLGALEEPHRHRTCPSCVRGKHQLSEVV